MAEELENRAKASGLFSFVDLDLRFENPTVVLTVDRDKAGAYGISMADLGTEWLTMVSNGYVNRMSVQGRSYRVIPQVARIDRLTPESLTSYYVLAQDGFPVPLSNLVDVRTEARPISLTQMNQLNAATVSAAVRSRSVERAVGALNQRTERRIAIVLGRAELVQHRLRATWRNTIDRAAWERRNRSAHVSPTVPRGAVEVSVAGLQRRSVRLVSVRV